MLCAPPDRLPHPAACKYGGASYAKVAELATLPACEATWLQPLKQGAPDLPLFRALLGAAAGAVQCIHALLAPALGACSAEDAAAWHGGRGPLWKPHHTLLMKAACSCGLLLHHMGAGWVSAAGQAGQRLETPEAAGALAAPLLAALEHTSQVRPLQPDVCAMVPLRDLSPPAACALMSCKLAGSCRGSRLE